VFKFVEVLNITSELKALGGDSLVRICCIDCISCPSRNTICWA